MAKDKPLKPPKQETQAQIELNDMLDKLEHGGMHRTKRWASMWQESLAYTFSLQHFGRLKHKDWDWVVVNYLWPAMMQEISKLTKNRQTVVATPLESDDAEFSQTWEGILQYLWDKGLNGHGMRLEHIAANFDRQLFGYSVSKIFWQNKDRWDDDTQNWVGDVKYKLWHPADFWAQDDECIDDGAVGTVRYVEEEWAIQQWPDFADDIKREASLFKEDKHNAWIGDNIRGQLASAGTYPDAGRGGVDSGTGRVGFSQLVNLILGVDATTKSSGETRAKSDVRIVRLAETFLWDREEKDTKIEEDIPVEELEASGAVRRENGAFIDPDGNEVTADKWPKRTLREFKKPTYPHGRRVLRVGRTQLNPDDQVYPYSRWPFVVIPHYLLPHMWQGTDGVQLYKEQQDMINVSVSHLYNNMKMYGDPKVYVEDGAIRVPKARDKRKFSIAKGAGAIIRLARGTMQRKAFGFIEPPPMNVSAIQMYSLTVQEFKNVQGLQDIAKGKKEPGKITATQAQQLSISSHDRIALQAVYEEWWLKECAKLVTEVVKLNYEPGRMVRIVGQESAGGVQEITEKLKNVRFDVEINAGFKLPFDRELRLARFDKAFAIVGQPVANPMTDVMLRELEIPDWQRILQKYQAWIQWVNFLKLMESVSAGQIDKNQALQVLSQQVQQLPEPQEQENANTQ